MKKNLCISIRFLHPQPVFHGRSYGGGPEWPPSPLRLFQALVDAFANQWRTDCIVDSAKPLIDCLQQNEAPIIVAAKHFVGTAVRLAVPNNDLDVWAGPLSKGNDPKKQPNELKSITDAQAAQQAGRSAPAGF